MKTGVRIFGVCPFVWPTLYILHKNCENLVVNQENGNLAVSRNINRQAVEDVMNPKFDEIAKKIDDGLAKIDVDIKGLKKDFKKIR